MYIYISIYIYIYIYICIYRQCLLDGSVIIMALKAIEGRYWNGDLLAIFDLVAGGIVQELDFRNEARTPPFFTLEPLSSPLLPHSPLRTLLIHLSSPSAPTSPLRRRTQPPSRLPSPSSGTSTCR